MLEYTRSDSEMAPSKDMLLKLALESHREQGDGAAANRKTPRFTLKDGVARCEIRQPGGSRHDAEVTLVDLSERGGQIIYPGYLHTGTQFRMSIVIPNKPIVVASGLSRWCRFLTGRYHAIGIQFDEPIRIRDLIDASDWMEACSSHPEFEAPIAGTLALYAEDDLSIDAMDYQLRSADTERIHARSRGALLDVVVSGRATAVVIDCDGEESSVVDLLSACRERYFEGPVLLVSLDQEASFAVDMDPLGRCRYVPKPMRNDALLGALRDVYREHPECVIRTSPIYSESPETEDQYDVLSAYIERCQQLVSEMETRLSAGGRESLLGTLRSIAGSAGSYGYTPLADEALQCIELVTPEVCNERLLASMRSLRRVVERLQPSRPVEDAD